MIEIKKLPSGFYAIFLNGTWIDAASATIEQAEQKAKTFTEDIRNGNKKILYQEDGKCKTIKMTGASLYA